MADERIKPEMFFFQICTKESQHFEVKLNFKLYLFFCSDSASYISVLQGALLVLTNSVCTSDLIGAISVWTDTKYSVIFQFQQPHRQLTTWVADAVVCA